MLEWLLGNGVDSQGQLEAAQREQHSKELELEARRKGFNSAEEMMAWSRQRNMESGGTIPRKAQGNPAMMHPKNILDYVLGKYKNAQE